MQRQLTTSRQLVEALTERAALWHDHSSEHHVAISPTNTQPLSSSPAKATGSPQQPRPEVVPLAANDASASPFAVAAGGYLSASASSTTRRNQLLLLQQALFPLTHSPRSDAASTEHDLRPHAEPKAKQLYETLVKKIQHRPWYMLAPEGIIRLVWDMLLFVFTAGLVVYVPILIAFYASMARCAYWSDRAIDPAPEANVPAAGAGGVTFMTLTNAAFLLDIFLNFLTGVMTFNKETGLIETSYDLVDVAGTYARTWLIIDIVSCLPLECMISAGGVTYNYNLGHLNRLLKATAVLRRAHGDPFRLINYIPYLKRNFNYSLRLVVVSFSLLMLGLHYFACALWLVLRVQSFPAQTWPVQLGVVTGENVYEQWTWSIFAVTSAMIGLGYGSYPPVTFPEAVLWIVEMICMAGGFAVVNGFIFSAILEFLADNARYKAQLMQATKEVEHRQLPPALAHKVMSYYRLKHSRHTSHMPSRSIMSELEPGLRLQVALASVGKLLHTLPVLKDCPQLLHRVALLVEPQVAAEGQLLAIPGSPASHLYFLTRGYADVYMNDLLIDTLVPGESFSELALLPVPPNPQLPPRLRELWSGCRCFTSSSWPIMFAIKALSNCNLLVLQREAFLELLKEYPWAEDAFLNLGVEYAEVLAELPMLDDVWHRAFAFDPLHDDLVREPDAADGLGRVQQAAAARVSGGLGRSGWWRHKRQEGRQAV